MSARRGQIAIYLAVVLVAIAIMALMNVNVFLSVRAKNRAMNGGDAAALAVAKWQGELLNRIGNWNVEHLKAAIKDNASKCDDLASKKIRTCFLEPVHGISKGNEAARDNGITEVAGGKMSKVLADHVNDIVQFFANDPELYPEPWSGAWGEYASLLSTELSSEMLAGPDAVEFADMRSSPPLTSKAFYYAVAGRQWCWFKFNGTWMFNCDTGSMPLPDYSASKDVCYNSEIYPLHLEFKPLPVTLSEEWVDILVKLTGCSAQEIAKSTLITNQTQRFAFFDSRWNQWSIYSDYIRFQPDTFPIIGNVKPEYDVLGCASKCRVLMAARDIMDEDEDAERIVNWTAAAKPFGTVDGVEGGVSVVTALKRLVTPCFGDIRLVPVDSVAASEIEDTSDADWIEHVKYHIASSPYFSGRNHGCWYCQQLDLWDQSSFRQQGVNWLHENGNTCKRPTEGGSGRGGTRHAH